MVGKYVFVFPLASGHLNPSLSIARCLVEAGNDVHYVCLEQMRAAIEDTGAVFHAATEIEPELYEGREVDIFGAGGSLVAEFCPQHKMITGYQTLARTTKEKQLPGMLRFLRQEKPSCVVWCPILCMEGAWAAKVLGIPSIGLLTLAGPGAMRGAMQEMFAAESIEYPQVKQLVESSETHRSATERINSAYGLGMKLEISSHMGKIENLPPKSTIMVTTTEDLEVPMVDELRREYEEEGITFVYVGPLLDNAGAKKAGTHKHEGTDVTQEQGGECVDEGDALLARAREAKAAGRKIILASMGTVITSDEPTLGWNGRKEGLDGKPCGLSGRELCHAAWAGVFDAFGTDTADEGHLILLSVGPQANPLEGVSVPPNAACAPSLPQVDILRMGIDVFLTHGGQNSFMEALSTATPVVVCPGFGDQMENACKAVDLRVGLKVDRPNSEAGMEQQAALAYRSEVSHAMKEVQSDAKFRVAVQAVADRLKNAGGVPRAAEFVLENGNHGGTAKLPDSPVPLSRKNASWAHKMLNWCSRQSVVVEPKQGGA